MSEPEKVVEVYLQPGDFFFGDEMNRLHTLLGSCISITLWHPRALVGGMCHYMMPGGHPDVPLSKRDGRYAADAIALFMAEVEATGTHPREWVAKMFGGGSQFPDWSPAAGSGLPLRNIRSGMLLLQQHGFTIAAQHFGGNGHRQVIFDIGSGDVWLKHVDSVSSGSSGSSGTVGDHPNQNRGRR